MGLKGLRSIFHFCLDSSNINTQKYLYRTFWIMCGNIHGKFRTFQPFLFPPTNSLDFNMIHPINLQSCDCVVELHPRYTKFSYAWNVRWDFFPKQAITVNWSICRNKFIISVLEKIYNLCLYCEGNICYVTCDDNLKLKSTCIEKLIAVIKRV